MLKPLLLLSVVVLFVATLMPGPTLASGSAPQEPPPPQSTNPVRPTAGSQERAKKLYTIDCAVCHGESGNGKTDLATDMQLTLLDWTDPKSLAGKSDQELFDIIRKGKDKMPAEDAGRAKNDDVWNLIIYIRRFSKGQ
jgi:mono/diheme cytochrome c family protein